MRMKFFIFFITLTLILIVIPNSVMAIKCSCEGTLGLDADGCQAVGLDYDSAKNECPLKIDITVTAKDECTQDQALIQSGYGDFTPVIACEYSANEGEPCTDNADCTTGNCDGGTCKKSTPPAPEQQVGLSEAESALDKFLGTGQLKGELIESDVPTLIGNILRVFLGFVGSLALVMFIYGGIMWMTSGGNAEKLKKAKNTLVWSVLGLVVIIASYSIVSAVISGIKNKSTIIKEQQQQTSACVEECGFTHTEELMDCKSDKTQPLEDCERTANERLRACRSECRGAFQ